MLRNRESLLEFVHFTLQLFIFTLQTFMELLFVCQLFRERMNTTTQFFILSIQNINTITQFLCCFTCTKQSETSVFFEIAALVNNV